MENAMQSSKYVAVFDDFPGFLEGTVKIKEIYVSFTVVRWAFLMQ